MFLFFIIKGVELLIDLNASSISLGLFKKFVLHSCSKSKVLVLNGCADNIHTFSLFFIFLFISLDNFPIFLEYEFNLLSFNKNLLSILSLDSNSYNFIKLKFLSELNISSNFKCKLGLAFKLISLFLRFSFNSYAQLSKLLSESRYQLFANFLQSSNSSITRIVSLFMKSIIFEGSFSIIPK